MKYRQKRQQDYHIYKIDQPKHTFWTIFLDCAYIIRRVQIPFPPNNCVNRFCNGFGFFRISGMSTRKSKKILVTQRGCIQGQRPYRGYTLKCSNHICKDQKNQLREIQTIETMLRSRDIGQNATFSKISYEGVHFSTWRCFQIVQFYVTRHITKCVVHVAAIWK